MTFPFMPTGARVDLSATTTTSRIALPINDYGSLRVSNASGVTVYLRFGDASVTATTAAGLDLLPGTVETLRVPAGATHLAGITASGTATVGVTPGQGV